MNSSTDLRRVLTELTQRFVDEVLAAIERAPLSEVAATLPRNASRAAAEGTVPSRGRRVAASDSAPTEDESARTYVRRSADEIQRLREVILETLRNAKAPIPASDIAHDVGVRTADLAFPMAQLRDQGIVAKDGQRAKAVYWLVESHDDRGKKKKKRKDR